MNLNTTEKKEIKLVCANCFHKNLWTGNLESHQEHLLCWSCDRTYTENELLEVEA